jgi:hypothetical protein
MLRTTWKYYYVILRHYCENPKITEPSRSIVSISRLQVDFGIY